MGQLKKKSQTEAHGDKGTEDTHQATNPGRFINPKMRTKKTTSHIREKLLKINNKENNLKSS